ncbi:hypothetical protein FV139_06695 [Parahaliea maris]|uniref:Uncharacterized protein n=1 Tax=Parahaliea maris TaxID=2716870 RepID=A0A5C9A6E1_9GAMM|nr:hypothetical protein [Parahaliea maris]TXS95564.1 hypothetical protein FV139_06695 [Parahaliea maris]
MKKFNLSELAAIAEVVGTVAVIVSLVFVAFQLQRNTNELQAGHSNDLYDSLREIELLMLSSPRLTSAYSKGWNGLRDEMSEDEAAVFQMYLTQVLNVWEQAYSRSVDGSMSAEEYSGWEGTFSEYVQQGMTEEDLEYVRAWFDPEFITLIEAKLKSGQH